MISFISYIRQLCIFVLSSSSILGLILGIALLLNGETTVNFDGDLTFGALDGFWLIFALPMLSALLFLLLSPLSFWVHRLLSMKGAESVRPNA